LKSRVTMQMLGLLGPFPKECERELLLLHPRSVNKEAARKTKFLSITMTTNYLTCFDVSKKHVFAIIASVAASFLSIQAQTKYLPSDERIDAGMGVERVAMFLLLLMNLNWHKKLMKFVGSSWIWEKRKQ
jgi:hypothetical protein